MREPRTLQQAIVYFANPDNCIAYMVEHRWHGKVTCPTCESDKVSFIPTRRLWECKTKHPKRQFSAKVGTIFEDSAISLDKWLTAVWMLCNCKNGVSSYEIARAIGVTQKSAWFMMHRIRLAMQDGSTMKLGGPGTEVEADETFIGGKARFMHRSKKVGRGFEKHGPVGKTIVMGILERGGRVRTQVVPHRKKHMVIPIVKENIEKGSAVFTDELPSYRKLGEDYAHEVIDHATCYVQGKVHTNGMENFWSLLKRGLGGTYVSVEPFHLFRYLDEQSFRYNNRKTIKRNVTDADRFRIAMSNIVGKRLTYAEVTGKVCETNF
jgi:transposase-like protein